MKKFLLLFVTLIIFGSVLVFADVVPPANGIKIKKTGDTKTAVIYSHSKHSAKIGEKAKDCTSCHVAAKVKNDAHKFCTDCHKSMKSGPTLTKCNECHKPAK
jgi:hypothetical protein